MREYDFTVYDWDSAVAGGFGEPDRFASYGAAGTALSVGGFDGMHAGHDALFNAVLARTDLLPGIVTFAKPPRALRHPAVFEGAVSTLAQRLDICREKGFAFAVVIDFSGEFGRMEGSTFLSILADTFCMKFLAEGPDFRCGYKGSADIDVIRTFTEKRGVVLDVIEPVVIDGERVSSTRIRAAVAAGDFFGAERLLRRPFRLDCSLFRWERSAPDVLTAEAGADGARTVQVLPPDGEYEVRALCRENGFLQPQTAIFCRKSRKITVRFTRGTAGEALAAVDFTA